MSVINIFEAYCSVISLQDLYALVYITSPSIYKYCIEPYYRSFKFARKYNGLIDDSKSLGQADIKLHLLHTDTHTTKGEKETNSWMSDQA